MNASERTIRVKALARVEGEGGLYLRLHNRQVADVQLRIFEPPRFFEAFLRGRALEEVPDITARICGICPVAYQMSAVHALERALGVQISPQVRLLRRLLYCGEWIESHALHVHLLHAPDFLGYDSGLSMARDHGPAVERGLWLKKHGNALVEAVGGRAIHPVNVAVGGFYRLPKAADLAALVPAFERAVSEAAAVCRWAAALPFPKYDRDYDMVALVHPDEYPMNEGRIASTDGTSWPVDNYEQAFDERHAAHSTALHSVRQGASKPYLVGPLARLNLNLDRLSPTARRLADEVGLAWPCQNMFQSIVGRGLELVHACEEALDILRNYVPGKLARAEYSYRAGEGCAATEAPRGLLYHRYAIDDRGQITFAKIVPPTSQNQLQIEDDLRARVPALLDADDAALAAACEHVIRNYDPCISCSTHFLRVQVERT